MEEIDSYTQARITARQLCDIMKRFELQDIGELKEWLKHNSAAQEIIWMLMDGSELMKEIELYRQQDKETAVKDLRKNICHYKRRKLVIRISRIAAVIIILLTLGILYGEYSETETTPTIASVIPEMPGPAIITPDGVRHDLSKITADTLPFGHNLDIVYKNDNEIRYTSRTDVNVSGKEFFSKLIIPAQCNYQVTLCDGSVVRLNAESRLEYPPCFPGHERRVRLIGEAYFEVKQDRRPFIVEINQVLVRVYGTKFNINAYENQNIETVLVKGKVGVSIRNTTQQERILEPNQLSRINLLTQQQEIFDVDVQKYIAWTVGLLRYDDDPLEKLVKDLGRWYGVEFTFADTDLKNIRISASINKDLSLVDVLSTIQATAKIKFNLTERRYTITR